MKTLPRDRHHLVLDNLRLVNYVINKSFKYYIHHYYEDLYQEGCFGLVKAAVNFDENLGINFATYAIQYIDGYIRRYTREKLTTIRMPRKLLDMKTVVLRELEAGRTEEEIEKEYNIESKHIASIVAISMISSLDFDILGKDDNKDARLHELIADDKDYYEEYLSEEAFITSIQKFIALIKNENHRHLYEEYLYSNLYYDKITQLELSKKYGFSQSYVARILQNYNKKFQTYLKKNLLID